MAESGNEIYSRGPVGNELLFLRMPKLRAMLFEKARRGRAGGFRPGRSRWGAFRLHFARSRGHGEELGWKNDLRLRYVGRQLRSGRSAARESWPAGSLAKEAGLEVLALDSGVIL